MKELVGKKDIHGTDIREGDIVRSTYNTTVIINDKDSGYGTWVCDFNLKTGNIFLSFITWCSHWIILGNIHENKELRDKYKCLSSR